VLTTREVRADALALARGRLTSIAARYPELLLEDKGLSLALHYRAAPQLEASMHAALRAIETELGSEYVVQPGKLVVELKPAGSDKGVAIAEFMGEAPFRGRTPVFVGDDATDEQGFVIVNELGGHSVKVGDGATLARWRLPTVRAVERWLARACAPKPNRTTSTASTVP
jgi:trehalose 6-phosphate phosphatase